MWPEKQELLELAWQRHPDGVFKEITISYDKVEGIQSAQKQASDKKYVPPNIRNFGEDSKSSAVPLPQGPIPGLPPGYTSAKSQSAFKGRNSNGNNRKKPTTNAPSIGVAADPADEERKKATAIKKKLKDIKVLKEKLEKGEKLDNNQLKKVSLESDLTKELAALKLSA